MYRYDSAAVLTLTDTVADLAERRVSPLELVESSLALLEQVQAELNAFTVVLAEEARARARELGGSPGAAGPLHGVPVVVKDLYDVAGARTTGSCGAYMNRAPALADSAVVAALRRAGAIVLAKTNQHELACGGTSRISSFGPVLNPWDPERIPGVRGAMPMIPAFDSAGPLTVSAEDCLLVHRIVAGYDDGDLLSRTGDGPPARSDVRGLRVGLPRHFFRLLHPEVGAAVERAATALEGLGAVVVEVEGPDPAEAQGIWAARWAEVASCYPDIWEDPRISRTMRRLFDIGRAQTGVDVARSHAVARLVKRQFQRALREADLLLAPTAPYPAPRALDLEVQVDGGEVDVHRGGAVRLTAPVNLAGLPALALPVGLSSDGLPVGAQLIGPEWSEELLCSVGAIFQRATDWHLRRPPAYSPPSGRSTDPP